MHDLQQVREESKLEFSSIKREVQAVFRIIDTFLFSCARLSQLASCTRRRSAYEQQERKTSTKSPAKQEFHPSDPL